MEDDVFDIYEVNPKSDTLAALIANSVAEMQTLFPIEEIPRSSGAFHPVSKPLMLIWSQQGRSDEFDAETITLAVVKPVSIDERRTLMQCEWVREIGSFVVAPSPVVAPVTPAPPVAPAYEPAVVARPASRAAAAGAMQEGNLSLPL